MSDSRERMLSQIRTSLEANRALLEAQAALYPPPHPRGPFVPTDLPVIEQFEAELTALRSYVHRCDKPAAAVDQVCTLLRAVEAHKVLAWVPEALPLPELAARLDAEGIEYVAPQILGAGERHAHLAVLDDVPVGISGVDAAIAESGTMIIVSGPGQGRLASLLPPIHIALLPADRIVRTLPQAFDLLRKRFGDDLFLDRSNVTFVTGPSRTADIELSLTLGVHGPKEIHAILIH